MRRLLLAALAAAFLVPVPAALAAQAPVFSPPTLLDPRAGTEPRIAIGSDDHRYVSTTRASDDMATLFISTDRGKTWKEQPTLMPGQTQPTIDVDVVAMPNGRIFHSELDLAGINFPSAVTEDDGKTWKQTTGSNLLGDQDRQWFAVGPVDPATKKSRVYMMYHNLATGFGNHNMWVATSTDGGETFGPPIPTTLPGDEAYNDLQCADSGGPTSIMVNQKTGRIYAVFTTRGAPIAPGVSLGGCASQPIEANIVAATRIWVAYSDDNSPGSWKKSLAVDNAENGKIVSMQLATSGLDNQGGVWIGYPESPRPYPDYTGAAVKLTHSDADLAKWTEPVTLVPPGGPGSILTHLAVGDPGKVAVAYYKGEDRGADKAPAWYTHVVQSLDAGSANPTVSDVRIAKVPSYAKTASDLMGACNASGQNTPIEGVFNGFLCDRSTDVWGVALDADCRLSVTWPGRNDDEGAEWAGTYVATQTGGPALCGDASGAQAPGGKPGTGSQGGPSLSPQGPFCRDFSAPRVTRSRKRIKGSRTRITANGSSSDRGCVDGKPNQPIKGGVTRVEVAIGRAVGKKCAFYTARGRAGRPRSCAKPVFLRAKGTQPWKIAIKGRFKKGRYVLYVRGVDRVKNKTPTRKPIRFHIN
jgi:hypothetical protein